MSHRHHLKPKHAGGEDSERNLTPPIPVVRHAMFHWCEWQRIGNEFDKIAWKCLSGLIDKEKARILANKEWHKRKLLDKTHPFLVSNRTWDQSETARKAAKTQLKGGSMNLLKFNTTEEHSLRVSLHQKTRVEEKTHHFLSGNETWDRSAVSKETSRRRILDGTLPLLSHNRTWDQTLLAKEVRANMSPESVELMIRKQTVSRRVNNGWTIEKLTYIYNNREKSSASLLKECQALFQWPNSRGAMQNMLQVLKIESPTQTLSLFL
jgi:hypothetical protein